MNTLAGIKAHWLTAALFSIALGLTTSRAEAENAQVIYEWNRIAQENIGGPPFVQTRAYAMVHIAMADAVVEIEGRFHPFHVQLNSPHADGASAKAAAAQAAHDVLVALVPANEAALNDALAESLQDVPPGPRWPGRHIGRKVAAAVLEWRLNDGYAAANPQPPTFLPSVLPGIWRQTASGPAQFSEISIVTPFGLISTTQFLPVVQPQLESAEYAIDFNDVKDVGSAASVTRSDRETALAQAFANAPGDYANVTNFFRVWQNVARDVAQDESLDLVRTARLFALMTASMNDGIVTSQTSKFIFRLWRPETAIAAADTDDNDATDAEVGWVPLLGTPPYPSHSSNASCVGTTAAQTLVNVFGTDSKSFTATWYTGDSPPVVVYAEPYDSFWAMAHDTGSSRVWGGIHFRFEITASEQACTQVANYVFDNYMQRRQPL